jgi:hypothetical protein
MSPPDRPEGALFLITRSNTPEEFPLATLTLLDRVISRNQPFYKKDLETLLGRIASASAQARHDSRFRNLSEIAAG